jgi:hypothetical protein
MELYCLSQYESFNLCLRIKMTSNVIDEDKYLVYSFIVIYQILIYFKMNKLYLILLRNIPIECGKNHTGSIICI